MNARHWRWVLAVIAVVSIAGFVWVKFGPLGQRATVASGYVARVVCSCRYVGGRDLASCATDLEPGMEIVRFADDPAAKRVTASVPMLGGRSARFTPGYGCAFDDGS